MENWKCPWLSSPGKQVTNAKLLWLSVGESIIRKGDLSRKEACFANIGFLEGQKCWVRTFLAFPDFKVNIPGKTGNSLLAGTKHWAQLIKPFNLITWNFAERKIHLIHWLAKCLASKHFSNSIMHQNQTAELYIEVERQSSFWHKFNKTLLQKSNYKKNISIPFSSESSKPSSVVIQLGIVTAVTLENPTFYKYLQPGFSISQENTSFILLANHPNFVLVSTYICIKTEAMKNFGTIIMHSGLSIYGGSFFWNVATTTP